MGAESFAHIPVLFDECIDGLRIDPNGSYLDGTVGGGGHAAGIAAHLHGGRLYAADKDPEALAAAKETLKAFPFVTFAQGDYAHAADLLGLRPESLDGVLLDLGVSSYQLDNADRGFSYQKNGLLDMRMGNTGQTAADLVNTLEWQRLADLFRDYGEESNAALIAKKIAARRTEKPITTTGELSEIIISALPPAVRRKEKNPARKVFQALRIAVNNELDSVEKGLDNLFELLKPGGRFCVITFHSIEDRIVKKKFAAYQQGCTCPPDFPICVCGNKPRAKGITKKPIIAAETEQQQNRRSRSAKLRILEKL